MGARKMTKGISAIVAFCRSNYDPVEGLLTRGAMKPDDRPLWFDVYKTFPSIVEPKFARPKPEANLLDKFFTKKTSQERNFMPRVMA
ncbi:unnamed protein product [Parnassius apollo]|uniref:(apollo) hypothetical protein n=1 Tax=Parnassius apollo TaxID=110799 RepID=A0A8S3Y804_PARAO|nr:unnamed protein product [Parnassius apollo]